MVAIANSLTRSEAAIAIPRRRPVHGADALRADATVLVTGLRWHRSRRLSVEIALHTLLLEPDERRLTTLWGARARVGERAGADLREDVLAIFEGQPVE